LITGFQNWGNIFFVNENTGYICGNGNYRNIYKTPTADIIGLLNLLIQIKTMYYIYFNSSNTGYVGGQNGIIYKTTNGGDSISN